MRNWFRGKKSCFVFCEVCVKVFFSFELFRYFWVEFVVYGSFGYVGVLWVKIIFMNLLVGFGVNGDSGLVYVLY